MTSNPMTNMKVYEGVEITAEPMTIAGTVNKSVILLAVVILTSCITWFLAYSGFGDKTYTLAVIGAICAFVLALFASFKPHLAKPLGIGYAAFEGLFLGGISAIFNMQYPGIVSQAVVATFCSMFIVLALFKARIIRATEAFRSTIIGATITIAVVYLLSIVLSFFHINALSGALASNSLLSIGLNAIIAVIACLNFILDFDFIERGVEQGAPKYLEWYGAFSMLVTLTWLYIEILRLLAKLNSRR